MGTDTTENVRRVLVGEVNGSVESPDPMLERLRLEALHGKVWDSQELGNDFEVLSYLAPFCAVRRKSDRKKGAIMFQDSPRMYFDFVPVE